LAIRARQKKAEKADAATEMGIVSSPAACRVFKGRKTNAERREMMSVDFPV
jgi:hypothetical protein